jgi:hypothetical protein
MLFVPGDAVCARQCCLFLAMLFVPGDAVCSWPMLFRAVHARPMLFVPGDADCSWPMLSMPGRVPVPAGLSEAGPTVNA